MNVLTCPVPAYISLGSASFTLRQVIENKCVNDVMLKFEKTEIFDNEIIISYLFLKS